MEHVLVTGGAGYIGSHACKALKRAGFVPVAYDSLITGWADAVKFGPLERGDLLDRARLDEVFARYRPVAVMHFAALSQVGRKGHYFTLVGFAQPFGNNRGVQSAGIGQHDFLDARHH